MLLSHWTHDTNNIFCCFFSSSSSLLFGVVVAARQCICSVYIFGRKFEMHSVAGKHIRLLLWCFRMCSTCKCVCAAAMRARAYYVWWEWIECLWPVAVCQCATSTTIIVIAIIIRHLVIEMQFLQDAYVCITLCNGNPFESWTFDERMRRAVHLVRFGIFLVSRGR